MFNGDADTICNYVENSQFIYKTLQRPLKTPMTYWNDPVQLPMAVGQVTEYDGITLISIKGGGHFPAASEQKPKETFQMFQNYVKNQNYSTPVTFDKEYGSTTVAVVTTGSPGTTTSVPSVTGTTGSPQPTTSKIPVTGTTSFPGTTASDPPVTGSTSSPHSTVSDPPVTGTTGSPQPTTSDIPGTGTTSSPPSTSSKIPVTVTTSSPQTTTSDTPALQYLSVLIASLIMRIL
ncbi:hypothetical protein B9Z55_008424 [Caenorhabditis nigoni]|uniref:Uncharacterized protein n=1 Tax=Caenorhabditis nigoni TaxID=1611254 RepID=A0A2G5UMQ2_9PELO|nr:hypothetical protein B9Z55_008424 [Caenorhabditis nigoni]